MRAFAIAEAVPVALLTLMGKSLYLNVWGKVD